MRYNFGKPKTPLNILAKELNLQSLSDRQFKNDILFYYKLLNNLIDCPELLTKIPLDVPHHTLHSTNTFYVQPQKQNFSHYAPLNRISLNSIKNFDFCFSIHLSS